MLAKNPKFHIAKLFLGMAYVRKGEYQKAVSNLQEAVKNYPQNSRAHYNLGVAYYGIGNLHQAISEYQEATNIEPDNVPILATLAMIHLEKGWYDDCIRYCNIYAKG